MIKKPRSSKGAVIPLERIERSIYLLRNRKVMLDSKLAELYQVPTSRLNEAVKRNRSRFPEDFMFRLTKKEAESLISQNAIPNSARGGRRTLPYAFTEHGVAMLSSVLSSDRAVQMNILIIRAFVKMRELLASQRDLAVRVDKLEASHEQTASMITYLVEEIEEIKQPPEIPPKRRIGFHAAGSA